MSILNQLSSQVGDRTEASNRSVAAQCLLDPALLDEIAKGLKSGDGALVGDCAEVMTKVAEEHPEWVAPYAPLLPELLSHKKTRVRWEAMHALALVAAHTPEIIGPLLPTLDGLIHNDGSTIVRDHAIDAVGNYAQVSPHAAEAAYPILRQALGVWESKHAGHALNGLINVAEIVPRLSVEVRASAEPYREHRKGVVRKAARRLMKSVTA